jgi:SAM-dependent methyltransferase
VSDHDAERDAFAERAFGSALGYFDVLSGYLGLRLGLYQALVDHGPSTSSELAEHAGIAERYAREWLEQQATRAILVADVSGKGSPRFSLPAGHAEALLDRDSLSYVGSGIQQLMSLRTVIDLVVDAFRTGVGIPYEAYGAESVVGQGGANRPLFLTTLPNEWLPAIPDVHARLSAAPGARIADVGCGAGWSSIAMARAYPLVTVDGLDSDEVSVEHARQNAAEAGLSERVRFHAVNAAELGGRVDFATAFECVHDMARPVEVLASVRHALVDDGAMLVVDERTRETFTGEPDDQEAYNYGWSVFDCLPAGLSDPPSAGTGAVMRPDTLAGYALEAGFSDFEVLPIEHDVFRLYLLRP